MSEADEILRRIKVRRFAEEHGNSAAGMLAATVKKIGGIEKVRHMREAFVNMTPEGRKQLLAKAARDQGIADQFFSLALAGLIAMELAEMAKAD